MAHATRLATLFTCLLLLAPARAEGPADGPPAFTHASVGAIDLELPPVEAARPFADAPTPEQRPYVVVIDADGATHHAWSRDLDAEPLGSAGVLALDTGPACEQVLEALKRGWSVAAARGEPDGIVLRADRRVPWVVALWALQELSATSAPPMRWAFAAAPTDGEAHRVVRYDLPTDLGLPSRVRTVPVLLTLDTDAQGRRWFRLREPHSRSFQSVKRELRAVEVGREGAAQQVVDALRSYQGATEARGDVPRLALRLELTPTAQRSFTFEDVLPLLAGLETLDADLGLRPVPSPGSLEAITPPAAAVSRPVFGAKPDRSRPAERRRAAVERGLAWLAAHQGDDGSWGASAFADVCHGARQTNGPEGRGKREWDTGVTGLALLAFLGAGYTHRGEHAFAKTVGKGLRHLKSVQDEEGCFGPREPQQWIYTHAVCSWAMVEAYGMTGSPLMLKAAQKGLDFGALCRNPYFAWRYGVRSGYNDTSVSSWMMMPIFAARALGEAATAQGREAPLRYDAEAIDGVRAWLEKMTDPDYGRVGYIQRGGSPARPQALIDRFPADRSEAMTAAALTVRALFDLDRAQNPHARKGMKLVLGLLPDWNTTSGSIDLVYWFWGSMATWQAGSSAWREWSKALDKALIDNQRKDTTECLYRGSWDPAGPWGPDSGRVCSTALACLALEEGERTARR